MILPTINSYLTWTCCRTAVRSLYLTSYGLRRPYSFHLSSYVLFLNLLSLLINCGQSKVSLFRYGAQNWIVSADTSQVLSRRYHLLAHIKFPYQCASELGFALLSYITLLTGVYFVIDYNPLNFSVFCFIVCYSTVLVHVLFFFHTSKKSLFKLSSKFINII